MTRPIDLGIEAETINVLCYDLHAISIDLYPDSAYTGILAIAIALRTLLLSYCDFNNLPIEKKKQFLLDVRRVFELNPVDIMPENGVVN